MTFSCFVGFDGFIDTLVEVVNTKKEGPQEPLIETFSTIKEWTQSLEKAAGKSCNYELLLDKKIAGGNAVNLARALAELGHKVDLAANVGNGDCPEKTDSVFTPYLPKLARLCNLGAAGQTHALEFTDGKLLLGIQGKNSSLSIQDLEQFLGKDWQETWLWNQDLIALVNWTMTPGLGNIWKYLAQNPPKTAKRRTLLIDLADPRKRSPSELVSNLETLQTLSKNEITLILSLNLSEAEQTFAALGCRMDPKDSLEEQTLTLADGIRQKLPSFVIVIHDSKLSVISLAEKTHLRYSQIIESPLVLTGGGDHFNAGLAHAWLSSCSADECLDIAMSCAGHYIARGQSPSAQDLSS